MKRIAVLSEGLDNPVALYAYAKRTGRIQRYRVTYGASVRDNLNYAQAALELGSCVLHSLSCAGEMPDDSN